MTDERLQEIERENKYGYYPGRALKKELLTEIYRLRNEVVQKDKLLDKFREAIDEACNIEGYDDDYRLYDVKDQAKRYWSKRLA